MTKEYLHLFDNDKVDKLTLLNCLLYLRDNKQVKQIKIKLYNDKLIMKDNNENS